ncbi:MAG: DNA polymerase III subunit alpha [Oscillospiraceae bacterium]|nr:DNA polymerase III subunit alpha [Oscillospiraceae bacterium]
MTDNFVHLHLHSEYSLLDGACRIKELVSMAKELGQKAVAVTDHGVMYAAVEFYNEAKKQGIKPIIGCEVYVAQRTMHDKVHKLDSSPYHLILLCKNKEGYHNLIKLVSQSFTEGFYNKPRVDKELLKKYSSGLICLSACIAGEVSRNLINNDYEGARKAAVSYLDIFGEGNFYLEVQNHGIAEEKRILPNLYRLSEETGIKLAATNDVHYVRREDADMQNVLLCIQTGVTVDDPDAMSFPTNEFYMKSEQQMRELFSAVPEAVNNTAEIADKCCVEFEFGVTKLPAFNIEGCDDNERYFRDLCIEGMCEKYGDDPDSVITDRMNYELDIIIKMGYVNYYLIVWDFIRYAKEHDIPVGPGRGSGAGSICAYCIGITGIDPMKYGLLFERFLNPERVSMPDFDIDFCIEGRQRVIDYVIEKYGSDRVAQIITFGTMAARGSIRDAGRAMGIPYGVCDKAAKLIPNELNITIKKALDRGDDLKKLYDSDTAVHKLIDMAQRIEGMPRNTSTHAAGVVIASAPVSEFVPLKKNDDAVVTQYTMTVLESLGLLKMDFLGLRNLTVIRDCVNMIHRKDPEFDISKVPVDDKAVFRMLAAGKTSGVFQFESAGMRSVIMRLVPENLEDLIAVISLYRPGPMDSIPKYIENRHNPDKVTYKHPMLESILKVTYGCIVYQEQVMEICRKLAGYSYGRADLVRRAMAKKKHDVMQKERQNFIYGLKDDNETSSCKGALANGVSEETANEIFDEMISFASYAFNKSHAAAYAYLSYQTAYLRCHYFKEYMAALMTSVLSNTPKLMEYISECEANSVHLLNPSVNESCLDFTITEDGIRFGLLAIKNLGRAVIESIMREREKNGRFRSLQNFCKRMTGEGISRRSLESLIRAGAFDGLGLNRRQMLENMHIIIAAYQQEKSDYIEGQLDFFGTADEEIHDIKVPFMEEYPMKELLRMEKESTGMYVSGHPLSQYSIVKTLMKISDISVIRENCQSGELKDNSPVCLLSLVTAVKNHFTKKGANMCFASLEDTTGDIDCVVFPGVYELSRSKLVNDEIIYVIGKISIKDDDCSILADNIFSEKEFLEITERKKLCFKTSSSEIRSLMEKLDAVLCDNAAVRVCYYLTDMKKTVSAKGRNTVDLTSETFSKLKKIMPDNYMTFI